MRRRRGRPSPCGCQRNGERAKPAEGGCRWPLSTLITNCQMILVSDHSVPPRLDAICSRIHASTSDSIQPTARAPSRTGWGKVPWPLAYRSCSAIARCGPVLEATAGRARARPCPLPLLCSSVCLRSVRGQIPGRIAPGGTGATWARLQASMNTGTRSAVASVGERPRRSCRIGLGSPAACRARPDIAPEGACW